MVIKYLKVYIFSFFLFVYALLLGVLGNVCFTNVKRVGNQRKSAFVYGIFPACLACKKQHSRHFQSTLYRSFIQNIFADKGRHGCPIM